MPGIERYRRLGLCLSCGKAPEPGKQRCHPCFDKQIASTRNRRAVLKAEGRCVWCKQPNDRLPLQTCVACETARKLRRTALKIEVFNAYGGCHCACCGESIIEFLQIDHINNNGSAHRKQVAEDGAKYHRTSKGWKPPGNGTGVTMYHWLKRHNYPQGFQVLCTNCNFAKGHYGECPHERMRREKS